MCIRDRSITAVLCVYACLWLLHADDDVDVLILNRLLVLSVLFRGDDNGPGAPSSIIVVWSVCKYCYCNASFKIYVINRFNIPIDWSQKVFMKLKYVAVL